MKKIFLFLIILVTGLVMVSCKDKKEDHDKVFKETLISYIEGDSKDHVTHDITLLLDSKEVAGVSIEWESSNSSVIKITGDKGIVTRYQEDKIVTLTAKFTIDNETYSKDFVLTVKSKENISEDTTPPVINGANDYILKIGDKEPNWLEGVTAIDDVDEDVEVIIVLNTVELDKIGIYEIVYKAIDSSNNYTTKKIKVTVLDDEEDLVPSKTYIENFDNISSKVSSYKDLSFKGINDIYWTIIGSRSDNELDGQAITFGGEEEDNSKLSATISGGITSFSVDVKKEYLNTNQRILELYINGKLIDSFTLDLDSTDVQKFTVDNINIKGDFTLELKQVLQNSRAQITIDNLTWTSYGSNVPFEKENLLKDLNKLNIITNYLEEGSIHLPSKGDYGSDITWAFIENTDLNNQYLDLENNYIYLPEDGRVNISLKAILSNGEYDAIKTFIITVGEGEAISILEAISSANNALVKIKGVITAYYPSDNGSYLFIQDNTAGIMVYIEQTLNDNIDIGKEISLTGIKDTQNKQSIINDIRKIDVISTKEYTAKEVNTPDDLNNNVGEFVTVSGLLKQTYGAYTDDYIIINDNGLFKLLIPEDMENIIKESIRNIFTDKQAGLEVKVNAPIYRFNNAYYLLLTDPNNIKLDNDIDLELVKYVLESNVDLPNLPDDTASDIRLANYDDLYFGANIIWTSDNENVLSSTGEVNQQNEDVKVRLSYKVIFNDQEIITGYKDVIVKAKAQFNDYYSSIEGLTGQALKNELTKIISRNVRNRSYDDAKYILGKTDAAPNKPGYCILVYNRVLDEDHWHYSSNGDGWNREHIWPQSKLGNASKSDLHNLKPADADINSSRSNLPYVDSNGSYGRVNGGWYPGDDDKGDIARIVFYMNTRWGLSINSSTIGNLETFIKWHIEDPVDDFERNRNEVIYMEQNNRNPYIDYPELVEEIYGSSVSYSIDTDILTSLIIDIDKQVDLSFLRKKIW